MSDQSQQSTIANEDVPSTPSNPTVQPIYLTTPDSFIPHQPPYYFVEQQQQQVPQPPFANGYQSPQTPPAYIYTDPVSAQTANSGYGWYYPYAVPASPYVEYVAPSITSPPVTPDPKSSPDNPAPDSPICNDSTPPRTSTNSTNNSKNHKNNVSSKSYPQSYPLPFYGYSMNLPSSPTVIPSPTFSHGSWDGTPGSGPQISPTQLFMSPHSTSRINRNSNGSSTKRGPVSPHIPTFSFSDDPACRNSSTNNTNIYVRGLDSSETDESFTSICEKFGTLVSCKAILDLRTNECKGFGFAMYSNEDEAKSALDGLSKLGYHVSYARVSATPIPGQESFNTKLKNLQDQGSTNIYLSNLPLSMTEDEFVELFEPYVVTSHKILVDEFGTSRGVGFARVETREKAQEIINKLCGKKLPGSQYPLQVRFADSFAQKKLKHQVARKKRSPTTLFPRQIIDVAPPIAFYPDGQALYVPNSHGMYFSPDMPNQTFSPSDATHQENPPFDYAEGNDEETEESVVQSLKQLTV